jgi:hypothetical protein
MSYIVGAGVKTRFHGCLRRILYALLQSLNVQILTIDIDNHCAEDKDAADETPGTSSRN